MRGVELEKNGGSGYDVNLDDSHGGDVYLLALTGV